MLVFVDVVVSVVFGVGFLFFFFSFFFPSSPGLFYSRNFLVGKVFCWNTASRNRMTS